MNTFTNKLKKGPYGLSGWWGSWERWLLYIGGQASCACVISYSEGSQSAKTIEKN